MKQEHVGGSWDRVDERAQAKWGKLTRAERVVFADRWQKRSAKIHEIHAITEEEDKRALAVLNRGEKPFYPTLQDMGGAPEDDRDTPSSLGSPEESPDRKVSDFYDWGSD